MAGGAKPPLISVAMPSYDPRPRHLRAAIESVRAQQHPDWELCVVDDGSTRARVKRLLRRYASRDARIRVELAVRNCGISAASNRAVGMCRGEYVAFLDHDDALTADALEQVAAAIAEDPSRDVIYSDQDKLTARGRRVAPFLKPDWSPTYALGAMYIGHLLVVRRALFEQVGGFDPSFDTIQDFELLLRLSERSDRIHHLKRILYHWRAVPGSIAAGAEEKSGVPELQARAVSEHLRRRGVPVRAQPHPRIPHRARLVVGARRGHPPVTVVVQRGRDERALAGCLAALERSRYPELERVESAPQGAGTCPARALNQAAAAARGEYVVFLPGDAVALEEDWVERLLTVAELPGVGVAGPLLVHPDGRVRAAGLALRRWQLAAGRPDPLWWHGGGPAEPLMRGAAADGDGYYGSLSCAREVAAVPAAGMMIRWALLRELGGFSERYRSRYHDADLCLRARAAGQRVVCTPAARLERHDPSAPRERVLDRALFIDTWFERLDGGDPYLNPGLTAAMAPASAASNGALGAARLVGRA